MPSGSTLKSTSEKAIHEKKFAGQYNSKIAKDLKDIKMKLKLSIIKLLHAEWMVKPECFYHGINDKISPMVGNELDKSSCNL